MSKYRLRGWAGITLCCAAALAPLSTYAQSDGSRPMARWAAAIMEPPPNSNLSDLAACPVPAFPADVDEPFVALSGIGPVRGVYQFQTEPDGSVRDPKVVSSSRVKVFDNAAVEALSHCRFTPSLSHDDRTTVSVEWTRVKTCRFPDYPAEARAQHLTGKGIYRFLVGTDGRVRDTRIDQSAGSTILDDGVLKSLSACTFFPAVKAGRPIEGWSSPLTWTFAPQN